MTMKKLIKSEKLKSQMLLAVFAVLSLSEDRRLDPFQFNLCLWNLEGFDPIYNISALLGSRGDDEKVIAQIMYDRLSTCDMFILPGLRNRTTAVNLIQAMEDHDFKGFENYPKEGSYDSTVLSRIDLDDPKPLEPENISYPINGSQCGYKGESKLIQMNFSFYANVTFHEPVPDSHVVSVRLKHGDSESHEECAYREAQAKFLCNKIGELFDKEDHVFLAGSFEADTDEPYHEILTDCGFTDAMQWAKGTSKYTRLMKDGRQVYWDMIFVNQPLKNSKYLDQLLFIMDDSVEEITLEENTKATYASTLFVHQPLTPRWRKFEIAYSATLGPVAVAFFIFLLVFSREKKDEQAYDNIGGK